MRTCIWNVFFSFDFQLEKENKRNSSDSSDLEDTPLVRRKPKQRTARGVAALLQAHVRQGRNWKTNAPAIQRVMSSKTTPRPASHKRRQAISFTSEPHSWDKSFVPICNPYLLNRKLFCWSFSNQESAQNETGTDLPTSVVLFAWASCGSLKIEVNVPSGLDWSFLHCRKTKRPLKRKTKSRRRKGEFTRIVSPRSGTKCDLETWIWTSLLSNTQVRVFYFDRSHVVEQPFVGRTPVNLDHKSWCTGHSLVHNEFENKHHLMYVVPTHPPKFPSPSRRKT